LNRSDLVGLIRDGILPIDGEVARRAGGAERSWHWADLGAGEGAFTFALADVLGPDVPITAVDKDGGAMRGLEDHFDVRVADFTKPLDLHDLDGVLMANSLHFVREKAHVLESVRAMLQPGGRLIIVEYGTDRGNPWVPYPFTYPQWEKMAARAGFTGTRLLKTVPSRWLGSMYSAVSES
jgi:ubiquinone/menaquinone biosynthesis C-methylase UbiE